MLCKKNLGKLLFKDILLYLSETLSKKIQNSLKNYVTSKKKYVNINNNAIANEVKSILKKIIKQAIAKTPLIEVFINYSSDYF